jgi:hypothetical protein
MIKEIEYKGRGKLK